ncbi:bifunctional UDP-N-acetylglucosamine diphosphorylase/glucosamine-1-phosphate N-acetyltransferase GlmU [Thermodesulfobacteriota bacterium]
MLAAGKGTRMESGFCKVLHQVAGRPMLSYVIDSVLSAGVERTVIIVGHQGDDVEERFKGPGIEFAEQQPQLGTGHAVAAAREHFVGSDEKILILCGDIPLIQPSSIRAFMGFHEELGSRLTVLTTLVEDPQGYGRIVRTETGEVARIVEQKDANETELAIREINTGIYIVDAGLLYSLIETLDSDNAQGEYYLTDIVDEATKAGITPHACVLRDSSEVMGVNTRVDLAAVSTIVWNRLRREMMLSGVTLLDPNLVYLDHGVKIGRDTVIHPGVTISGETEVGEGCEIESGAYISDCKVGDGVRILLGSRLESSTIGDGTCVGPMAHLRPGSAIGKNARIGNYVEVKKSVVGDGSKASHLTYLGDSTIGRDVNVGCGTITCNYDGKAKHPTIIGDGCFIGSDVQFVAPVEIGDGSLIGAGSTITKNVPPETLAVTRAKQKMYPLRKGQGPKRDDENRKP